MFIKEAYERRLRKEVTLLKIKFSCSKAQKTKEIFYNSPMLKFTKSEALRMEKSITTKMNSSLAKKMYLIKLEPSRRMSNSLLIR